MLVAAAAFAHAAPPPMRSPPPPSARAAPVPPPPPPPPLALSQRLPAGALHHLQHFGSMSRTLQYKKITKPLLERKRRARINRCLDELKELMVGAFEAEGENVAKLEKADILELTVRHLHKLHEAGRLAPPPGTPALSDGASDTDASDADVECDAAEALVHASRFQAGFSRCAAEAVRYLLSAPGLDAELGRRLVRHLAARCLNSTPFSPPPPAPPAMPPAPPSTPSHGPLHHTPPTPAAAPSARPRSSLPPSPAKVLFLAAASPVSSDADGGGCVWRPW